MKKYIILLLISITLSGCSDLAWFMYGDSGMPQVKKESVK